jgi:invasion protein IalB
MLELRSVGQAVGLGLSVAVSFLLILVNGAAAVEQFGDWQFACPAAAAANDKKSTCRLTQSHAGATALLVTILVQEAKGTPVAVVSVPEGVYLAPGIELKVDDGSPFKLLYETCNSSGCHAGFKIAGDIASAFKRGQLARFTVFDSKQKPALIDVSLKGLTKGLERLQQEAK